VPVLTAWLTRAEVIRQLRACEEKLRAREAENTKMRAMLKDLGLELEMVRLTMGGQRWVVRKVEQDG
jgi:hypothetical protein